MKYAFIVWAITLVGLNSRVCLAQDKQASSLHESPEAWQVAPACGPNALYFMLRINGFNVNYEKLLAGLSPPEKGNSLEELKQAAIKWGMKADAYRLTKSDLSTIRTPFIAHLEYEGILHYVVVVGQDKESVKIWNLEEGKEDVVAIQKFNRMWSGYVLATGFLKNNYILVLTISSALALVAYQATRLLGPSIIGRLRDGRRKKNVEANHLN